MSLTLTASAGVALQVPVLAQSIDLPLVREPEAGVSRQRAFSLLEARAGGVERLALAPLGATPPANEEMWQHRRLEAAGGRSGQIAGLLHHDLQHAEQLLFSHDPAMRSLGLALASNVALYAALLEEKSGDARLRAAVYEGFLVPFEPRAPRHGRLSRTEILEGAAVAWDNTGQKEQRMEALLRLLRQASTVAQGDMVRVHLAEEYALQRRYAKAWRELKSITTRDLLGAKSRMPELLRLMRAQQGATNRDKKPRAEQDTTQTPGEAAPALGVPGIGVPGLGLPFPRMAQAGGEGGGGGAADAPGEEELTPEERAQAEKDETQAKAKTKTEEDTPFTRATRAAQKAASLARQAQTASTIALARLLDAADAGRELEAAQVAPKAPQRKVSTAKLQALEQSALAKARLASKAAKDAQKATQLAQEASAEAARLALLIPGVEDTEPKVVAEPDGAPAPIQPAPAPLAPAAPAPAGEPAALKADGVPVAKEVAPLAPA